MIGGHLLLICRRGLPIISQTKIKNFQAVTDWLYRGGQPSREQLCQLANMGVKTVVCLRSGRLSTKQEQAAVEQLGMRFVHLPLNYLVLPDQSQIHAFLELLDERQSRPLFVHCFHGVDRTGFLIAVYRIARLAWPVQEAYNEMKRCGFHRFRLPHFKWVLFSYAKAVKAAAGNEHSSLSVKRNGL